MKDFTFYNPVKVVFGNGKSRTVGEEAAKYGKKVLFLYGKESIKKNGLHDTVAKSLSGAGVNFVEHGGVRSNPVVSHAREGVRIVRENDLEAVLAVGGGSVIDEAKAIAAGAVFDGDVWDFFVGKAKPDKALPIITVPTMAASGSEMNGNTVVTNSETGQKLAIYSPALFPKLSVLDPSLTVTVPENYTAYGIVDAFSHVLEAYFNGMEHFAIVQDRLAEGIFTSLMDISRRLMMQLHEYEPRADMMWASSLALAGIVAAGRGKVRWENHMMAHALGAVFDTPHGAALSVVMPGWMKFSLKRKTARLALFAERVMGVDRKDGDENTALQGIEKTREWFSFMGVPVTLAQLGIQESDIPSVVDNVLPYFQKSGMTDMGGKEAEEILHNCV